MKCGPHTRPEPKIVCLFKFNQAFPELLCRPKKFDESGFSNGDSGSLKQKGVDSYLNSDIPLPPSSDEEDEQLSGNEDVCNLNRITSYNHEEEDEDDVDSDENS